MLGGIIEDIAIGKNLYIKNEEENTDCRITVNSEVTDYDFLNNFLIYIDTYSNNDDGQRDEFKTKLLEKKKNFETLNNLKTFLCKQLIKINFFKLSFQPHENSYKKKLYDLISLIFYKNVSFLQGGTGVNIKEMKFSDLRQQFLEWKYCNKRIQSTIGFNLLSVSKYKLIDMAEHIIGASGTAGVISTTCRNFLTKFWNATIYKINNWENEPRRNNMGSIECNNENEFIYNLLKEIDKYRKTRTILIIFETQKELIKYKKNIEDFFENMNDNDKTQLICSLHNENTDVTKIPMLEPRIRTYYKNEDAYKIDKGTCNDEKEWDNNSWEVMEGGGLTVIEKLHFTDENKILENAQVKNNYFYDRENKTEIDDKLHGFNGSMKSIIGKSFEWGKLTKNYYFSDNNLGQTNKEYCKFNNEKVNDNEREEKFPGTCFLNNDIILTTTFGCRGTDYEPLCKDGLHVLVTFHKFKIGLRQFQQSIGRCGRSGRVGSYSNIWIRDDTLTDSEKYEKNNLKSQISQLKNSFKSDLFFDLLNITLTNILSKNSVIFNELNMNYYIKSLLDLNKKYLFIDIKDFEEDEKEFKLNKLNKIQNKIIKIFKLLGKNIDDDKGTKEIKSIENFLINMNIKIKKLDNILKTL